MGLGRLLVICSVFFACVTVACGQSNDFSGDLSGFVRNGSGLTHYVINPTAGVGGGGGLIVNPGGPWGTLMSSVPYSNGVGDTSVIQLDYRQGTNPFALDLLLGFRTAAVDPSSWFATAANGIVARIESPTSTMQRSFHVSSSIMGRGGSAVAITPGEWFRLEFEIRKSGVIADSYDNTIRWYSLGPTGTSVPILLQNSPSPFPLQVPPAFAAAPVLYAGLVGNPDTMGYDNFSAVPEPSSAIALLALAGVVARRRR